MNNKKGYIILLNIFLALIVASQIRVWRAGPFSGYFFLQTFVGLALIVLGVYQTLRRKELKNIELPYPAIEIFLGAAFLYEFMPVLVNSVTIAVMAAGAVMMRRLRMFLFVNIILGIMALMTLLRLT